MMMMIFASVFMCFIVFKLSHEHMKNDSSVRVCNRYMGMFYS